MRLKDIVTDSRVTMNREEIMLMEELYSTLVSVPEGCLEDHMVLDLSPFARQTLVVALLCGVSAIKEGAAVFVDEGNS